MLTNYWPLSFKITLLLCLSLPLVFNIGCDNSPTATPPVAPTDPSLPGEEPGSETPAEPAAEAGTAESANAEEDAEQAAAGFKLGDMIEPFTPPTLEELDSMVEWEAQPVLDSLELRREDDAKHPSKVTVAEALKLRNTSKETNDKILEGLGQLPANDNAVNWDASINRHSGGDINSTFPLFMSSTAEFDINSLIGIGLFSFDWTFQNFAAKEAVVSWHSSKDRLFDKVIIRDDLTWSDGKPITAHDVAYSYKLILTKSVPCRAVRSGTDQIKWVEAYDDQTVVYFHKESLVTNNMNMNFPIIPKHVYEPIIAEDPLLKSSKNSHLEDNPVVGGPYTVRSRSRGQEIIFDRRDSFYLHNGKQVRDKPYYKVIRFRVQPNDATALLALKAGDLDEMQLSPELWQNQTDGDDFYQRNTKVFDTEWANIQFIWNIKDPRFADKRVRWAMAYAFDHEELLNTLLFGLCEPCTGNFHPTSRWSPVPAPTPLKQDLDKAEDLLDEAGWVDSNGDGIRDKMIDGKRVNFEFTIITNNRQLRIDICNLLKESLEQIGIRCQVTALEFPAMIEKLSNKDFQASCGGWGAGTDPDTSENIFATDQPRNYGSYSSKKVDDLFLAGKREFDPEKRRKIYQDIARQLWDDQPYCWLYYMNAQFAFSKSLRGYKFSPRGPYHYGPGFSSIYSTVE